MRDGEVLTVLGQRLLGTASLPRGSLQAQKKSGGPKTPALTCRMPLFDQATEKMPRPTFWPIPTSVFCASV
jgi:hypothetical protein